MPASSFIYNYAKSFLNGGSGFCAWSSTTASFYVTLVSNNYVPNEDDRFASVFSGAELGAASFTSGFGGTIRLSLTGRVLNTNLVSNQAEFQANTLTWSGIAAANGVAHAFVALHQNTSNGNSELVTYNSLGGFPITPNGTNLTLSFTSAGVVTLIDA